MNYDFSAPPVDFEKYTVPSVKERLHADPSLTGKGITIAFLDSGFYPHPDLYGRIAAYHDTAGEVKELKPEFCRNAWNWHGMQTSVVAAGNGALSDGRYCSLAPDAKVVLVKVSRKGHICDDLIVEGIKWVRANAKRLNIRILNISVGSDRDPSALDCEISKEAEALAGEDVLVIAAAGNDGGLPRPPANAPSVLTVGGSVSREACSSEEIKLYSSNFGVILDLVVKPEVIAPAAWVAAPLLPGTEIFRRAEYYYDVARSSGGHLLNLMNEAPKAANTPDNYLTMKPEELTEFVDSVLKKDKIVGRYYQHVDGTSFAAPITASLAAQLMEANPSLTPAAIRQILMSTADRVQGQNLLAQGCGVVNAGRAAEQAKVAWTDEQICELRPPLVENGRLSFVFVNYTAKKIELLGDFNNWTRGSSFEEVLPGLWKIEIEAPKIGMYRYKFLADGSDWFEDPANLYRKPNVFGTYDSVLSIT